MLYTSGTPQAALYDENNYEQKKRSANIFTIQPSLFTLLLLHSSLFLFSSTVKLTQIKFSFRPIHKNDANFFIIHPVVEIERLDDQSSVRGIF